MAIIAFLSVFNFYVTGQNKVWQTRDIRDFRSQRSVTRISLRDAQHAGKLMQKEQASVIGFVSTDL